MLTLGKKISYNYFHWHQEKNTRYISKTKKLDENQMVKSKSFDKTPLEKPRLALNHSNVIFVINSSFFQVLPN